MFIVAFAYNLIDPRAIQASTNDTHMSRVNHFHVSIYHRVSYRRLPLSESKCT